MAVVELALGDETLSVLGLTLRYSCDKFADSVTTSRYEVTSPVSVDVFRIFVDAIVGKDVEITTDNVSGLGQLAREFGFWRLTARLSDFRITQLETIACAKAQAQERRIAALEADIDALKVQLSSATQEAVAAERRRVLTEEVSALKSWVFPSLDSTILAEFPPIFAEFHEQKFSLLWRGSRDGYGGRDFHNRCDGHKNTLMIIEDVDGNVFGGYTPVEWESPKGHCHKSDDSETSFLFTLKNPHGVPAQKFPLKADEKRRAINCFPWRGPGFGHGCDLFVAHNCDQNSDSVSSLGETYINNTGVCGRIFFTGSHNFKVKEIEVFEITE
jgi:hypothetical protein